MTDLRDYPIEVMVNRYVKGKMPAKATKADWQKFNMAFHHEQTTARGLAIEIWRGWAFCPVFHQRRRKENFLGAWHIALDFDTMDEQSSIPYLREQPLINDFASFAYTTPSHTPQKPKARVVWIFDKPITDLEQYERLYRAMLHRLPWADHSTKDAARLFYGSPRCDVWDNWSILGLASADLLIEEWEAERPKPKSTEVTPVEKKNLPPKFLKVAAENLLDNVRTAPDGEKHDMLNRIAYTFGGYVAGGYYDEPEVERWLQDAVHKMQNVRSVQAAYDTIKDGLRSGMSSPLYFEVEQAPSLENVL